MSKIFRYDPAAAIALQRAAFAACHAASSGDVHHGGAAGVAASLYPDHKAAALILRGAVSPADSSSAAALAITAVADFVSSLAPQSAAARLIDAGLKVSLDGLDKLAIPKRAGQPNGGVSWVRPGNAIPARMYSLDDIELGPVKKMAVISVVSHEIASRPNGDEVVATLLREDTALSLDAAMFGNAAATADAPAGLLNGVSALTASAATSLSERMLADLEAISGAIIAAGGVDVTFIASPRQWNATRLRLGSTRATVWPSAALADGVVIGIETAAFVSSLGAVPKITASEEATIVMDDTAAPLSTAGTPNAVSAPARSMFQTNCIALKAILDIAFAMRASGRVAYVSGATWGAAP